MYLAPQNIPRAISVLTLGNKVILSCIVTQFLAVDEDSDLRLWYAIGTYHGGTNVLRWTEIRGAALVSPAALPCSVPLYFMVKARNSQGLETIAHCSIPTYDCTFPDGRVDGLYK